MSFSYKELMKKLGVGHELGPYETCPWSLYDEAQGATYSAEVRNGPDGDEIEGEIQIFHDEPPAGGKTLDLVCYLKATPSNPDKWHVNLLLFRSEPYGMKLVNFEEKACNFFAAVVQKIKASEVPDVDEILKDEMHSRERPGGGGGGGGGRSPKMKGGELLGMKTGF